MKPADQSLDRRSFLRLGGTAVGAAAASQVVGTGLPAAADPTGGEAHRTVHVRHFGARPDDGRDDTAAIRKAIKAAMASPVPSTVVFEVGTYTLTRDVIAGASLPIANAKNLTLLGAIDRAGTPLTRLVTKLTAENDTAAATQITLNNCEGMQLSNLILDYDERATSSGEIVAVDQASDTVTVDIFARSTHFDGMLPYSANSWDLSTQQLNHVAPLTIGANPDVFTEVFRPVPGGQGRRYRLTGYDIAERVSPGDGMSWHFNVTGGSYNIYGLGCRDLTLDNIRIHNAIGVGILLGYGHNLTVHDVHVTPSGDDQAVGPRDAIHLSNNTGSLSFTGGHLKGVRWDPLVSRSSFLTITEIVGPRQFKTQVSNTSRELPHTAGDKITFWVGQDPATSYLETAVPLDEEGSQQLLTLAADIPPSVAVGTLLTSSGHEWEDVRIADTTIECNVGTALVFMNQHLLLENCRFANNAYHDIGFGTTSGPTGSFARDVVIRDNHFEGSAWVRKYSHFDYCGAITTFENNGAFTDEPYNSNIVIEDNLFTGLDIEPFSAGVYLRNARGVTLRNNTYRQVSNRVVVDPDSTADIVNDAP